MAIGMALRTFGYYGLRYGAPAVGILSGVAFRETLARGVEHALPYSPLDTFVSSLKQKATIPVKTLVEKISSKKLNNLEQAFTKLKILNKSSETALIAMEDLDAKKLSKCFQEQGQQRKEMQDKLAKLGMQIGDISPEEHAYKFKESSKKMLSFSDKNKNVEVDSMSKEFIKKINDCVNEKFEGLENDSLKKEFEEIIKAHIKTFETEEEKKLTELDALKSVKTPSKTKDEILQEMNAAQKKLKTEILEAIDNSISTHEDAQTQFKAAAEELKQLPLLLESEKKSISPESLKGVLGNFPSLKSTIENIFKKMDINPEQEHDLAKLETIRENCTQGKKLNEWISWATGYIPFNKQVIDKVDSSYDYMSSVCNYNTAENKLSQWGSSLMEKMKSVGSSIWSKLGFAKSATVD